MDFFRHQDQARHKTGVLILLFVLAVLFIVLIINFAAFLIFSTGEDYVSRYQYWMQNIYWEHPTALAVLLIFAGSLKRYFSLRDGGEVVAEMVGASRVDMESQDSEIKKYINVVSEMSIASGVPMPVLYLMEREIAINAFVAGYKPTEAVMVVTRGALEALNRDELQGVVAHEFSHILNGDMRINIRLMSVLAGILTISQFGRMIMRGASRGSRNRNSGPVILVGLGFFMTGYIGLFFGRLIKAAISRQREYLADASAVQFTRNPSGIAGALYKIKKNITGGVLNSSRVEEMSHMCFVSAMNFWLESWLATHPVLDERIRLIDPALLPKQKAKSIIEKKKQEAIENVTGSGLQAAEIAQMVGNPASEHLVYAAAMLQSFSVFGSYIHNVYGAQLLIYALIISGMKDTRQRDALGEITGGESLARIDSLLSELEVLDKRKWLPLVDVLLPVLKNMDDKQRHEFMEKTDALVKLDQRVSLFEFVLLSIVQRHLAKNSAAVTHVKYHSFKHVIEDVQILISLLVHAGQQVKENRQQVFVRVMKTFVADDRELYPVEKCNFNELTRLLENLNGLAPLLKKTLITVCADCVLDDGIIMSAEAELLRAVCESLECPMPPLLTA